MSFQRAVVFLALVGAGVHFFRKDLQKVARVLQKPAENFVKDVKRELETTKAKGSAAEVISGASEAGASQAAEKARIAAAAAQDVAQVSQQAPAPPAPDAAPAASSGAPPLR